MVADFVPSISDKPLPDFGYTVSYSTAYGTIPSFVSVSVLTASELPTLSYNGYTFLGWYYDSACTNVAEVGDLIIENTTLYAKWETSPTATFDLSTLRLSAGTYSITVKARADGYVNSAESSAMNYIVSI